MGLTPLRMMSRKNKAKAALTKHSPSYGGITSGLFTMSFCLLLSIKTFLRRLKKSKRMHHIRMRRKIRGFIDGRSETLLSQSSLVLQPTGSDTANFGLSTGLTIMVKSGRCRYSGTIRKGMKDKTPEEVLFRRTM